jgi:hypothetical protein
MMTAKRNKNALYWQLQRQHRAYMIKGYLATYGSVTSAAEALGVNREVISREIDVLRGFGLIDHPFKSYSRPKDADAKKANGSIDDLARAHVETEAESPNSPDSQDHDPQDSDPQDPAPDDVDESDHEPEPSE